MAESARSLQLVASGTSAGLEAFGQAVRQVLGTHPDLASEAVWQQFGQLIAAHWTGLCKEQAALSTWQMLTRCAETITRLRRAQGQERGNASQDALEQFRSLMVEVLGQGDENGR